MEGLIQMLPPFLRQFSTHHDFSGQKSAERAFQVILVISGIIGFFIGYSTQQLSHAVYAVLAGGVIASIVTLPPWPCFRRQPLQWQQNIDHSKDGTAEETKETKKTK
ncbi:unnamed protein product, partial [Mesorhabditis belari]|uniref:Signal peptidase complex subunit 1 n=1 Tax=Mesorhabditis belari TaxID=2138241 RepID=A0AAF3FD22_9BILA